MLYFAYGSNMSLPRLLARLPEARCLGRAVLPRYQLRFHKKGTDGSAKCDALLTGKDKDQVHGVLYELAPALKQRLDCIEDAGVGYEDVMVSVVDQYGRLQEAYTYVALHIDCSLHPYPWYLTHVLYGAQAAGLPESYVDRIRQRSVISDPNELRTAREQRLYRRADLDHLANSAHASWKQRRCL